MERIRKFPNVASYEAERFSIPTPNVCWCVEENELEYNKYVKPYSEQYLTFEAIESGTFKFSGVTTAHTVNYSLDNGETWTTLASNTDSPTVTAGNKILFKATLTPSSSWPNQGIGRFSSTESFNAMGNPMSLLYGDNFRGQTNLSGKNYALANLFSGCTNLVDAENLSLLATTLSTYCYYQMFRGCTALTSAPLLPATTLANGCYWCMFANTSLLPDVTNIKFSNADGSVGAGLQGLFAYTNITNEQLDDILKSKGINDYSLPATTLTQECYNGMFRGCTSLTTAPALPATTLATYCYNSMFADCTSLITPPSLQATSLADYCYYNMFYNCSSLTTALELPAATLAYGCYRYMFESCSSLTTAPTLPAKTLTEYCYGNMFQNCTLLNSITCLATDISASNCTTNWVSGVAASGTFTKDPSMTSWTSGINGIPSNWTVQDYQE